ncbi:S-layer homology domain-containing protein [Thermoanaerobacterium thermosulfurigenes]|uniref:RCC1 domain-containing protein n=1 Tax=Thermoanaerobacterium thermosulfurigenes TaxID=33950 RepID=UPI003EF40989
MNIQNKFTKRFIVLFLSVLLLMTSTISTSFAATNTSFKDISGHWAEKEINSWISKGLIAGYEDGAFKPDNPITRAEFIALVNRSFNLKNTVQINFSDVKPSDWYYSDIKKAKAAGFISGYEDNTMRPNKYITREEAASIISRLLNLKDTDNSDISKFNDAREISNWAKGAISAVVKQGYMGGYPDNTFRPENFITRAETVVILNRAINSQTKSQDVIYDKAGTFGPDSGTQTIEGNVIVSAADVTLKNTIIKGDLLLSKTIGDGNVYLKNVTVNGITTIEGGGEHSIIIEDSSIGQVIINKDDDKIRVVAQGTTNINQVELKSGAKLEEAQLKGEGFTSVTIDSIVPSNAQITLNGNFKDINVNAKNVSVSIGNGTVENLAISKDAPNVKVDLADNAKVTNLIVNSASSVTGKGKIEKAEINSNAVTIEEKPDNIEIASGITVKIAGEDKSSGSTNNGNNGGSSSSTSGGRSTNNNTKNNNVSPSVSNVVAISAGGVHTVALRNDGTVWTWGRNDYGQLGNGTTKDSSLPIQVKGISNVVAVSARRIHTVALRNDGTVWTWGDNECGQLGNGTTVNSSTPVQVKGISDVVAISAGDYHTVALKNDGTVWTWGGYDGSTPVQVKGISNVKAISAGDRYTVALKNDGTVWSWGNNDHGQLGNGTTADRSMPVQVEGISDIVAIGAGDGYTVALESDGTVWTWEYNGSTPVQIMQVNGLSNVVAVATGQEHIVELKNNGTVWAWGDNRYGQLGNGTTVDSSTPLQVKGLSGVKAIAAGYWYTVALKNDGTVWTWGANDCGQLGNGTTDKDPHSTPVQVKGLSGIVAIVAGDGHTVALKNDGTVWTWGWNFCGQLGNGTTADSSTPVQVKGLSGVKAIAAGYWYTVALKNDGTVWAWGANDCGELGNGTTADSSTPVQVKGISDVKAIATGDTYTVALKNDGTVWAWGDNYRGQLGNGTADKDPHSTPVQVKGISDVKAIAAGSLHTVALKNDGTVWAWGYNYGNYGTTTKSFTPVQIKEISGVITISSGGGYTVALKNDGTVWAWGDNYRGQLGNGTADKDPHSTPVQVKGISDVKAIAAGSLHTVALKNDGTVWAWGYNYGNYGTTTKSFTPVQIKEISGVITISSGGGYTVALKNDGTVWVGNVMSMIN